MTDSKGLSVNKALHKAAIDIDEKGTEAQQLLQSEALWVDLQVSLQTGRLCSSYKTMKQDRFCLWAGLLIHKDRTLYEVLVKN